MDKNTAGDAAPGANLVRIGTHLDGTPKMHDLSWEGHALPRDREFDERPQDLVRAERTADVGARPDCWQYPTLEEFVSPRSGKANVLATAGRAEAAGLLPVIYDSGNSPDFELLRPVEPGAIVVRRSSDVQCATAHIPQVRVDAPAPGRLVNPWRPVVTAAWILFAVSIVGGVTMVKVGDELIPQAAGLITGALTLLMAAVGLYDRASVRARLHRDRQARR